MLLSFENGDQLNIPNQYLTHDIVLQGFIQDFPETRSIPFPIYSLKEAQIYYYYVKNGICKCTLTVQKIAETLCNDYIKGKIRH